jgi:thymidylate synthase
MNDYFRTEGESPNEVEEVAYAENEFDFQYKDNIRYILSEGEERTDRTGVRTMSAFGDIGHKIDLRRAYPATSLKRLAFQTMKVETIDWMLQGKCDLKTLKEKGVRIWDQNVIPGTEIYRELCVEERLGLLTEKQKESFDAFREELRAIKGLSSTEYEDAFNAKLNNWGIKEEELIDGALGPIYGKQWRAWEDVRIVDIKDWIANWKAYADRGFDVVDYFEYDDRIQDSPRKTHVVIKREIDQVMDVEKAIKNRSDSRRIILTGWNVAQLDEMSLPPCHTMAQWYVSQKRDENGLQFLDCKLYQRSADFLLGVPFNVAQYALITEMYAKAHGLRARFLHHTVGDAHIYMNHLEQGFVAEIMNRPVIHKAPKLQIKSLEQSSILDFTVGDFSLVGYESHDAQKNVPIAK